MVPKIDFRKIELQDKKFVESFTMNGRLNICDFAFSNLYGWSDFYATNLAVFNDSLIIRFNRNGHNHPFYLPVLAHNNTDRKKSIQTLIDISKKNHYPLTFMCVTPFYHDFLTKYFPNQFVFTENRDGCDYIYLREKLTSLSGKKLQSKRNHINKFEKLYPHYEVVDITDSMIEECIRLENEWLKDHNETDSRIAEKSMIKKILNDKKALELIGIAIKVEGKIVAFSLGSIINDDTFGVHVEKANTDYEGAFTIINREFAKRVPEKYTYINREEDMGIAGLRKSKLSYKPESMLCKKIAVLKDYDN